MINKKLSVDIENQLRKIIHFSPFKDSSIHFKKTKNNSRFRGKEKELSPLNLRKKTTIFQLDSKKKQVPNSAPNLFQTTSKKPLKNTSFTPKNHHRLNLFKQYK